MSLMSTALLRAMMSANLVEMILSPMEEPGGMRKR